MAELVICPRCDRRFDRDMVKDGFAICPYCEEEVEFPVMTREEAIKMLNFLAIDTTGNLAGEQGDDAEFLVRVVDALDMAIAALREQCNIATNLQPEASFSCKWISVKERLPEENQRVILCIPRVAEGGNVRTGWLEPIKMWFTDSRDRLFYEQVTHWMPLPEPPKEDTP